MSMCGVKIQGTQKKIAVKLKEFSRPWLLPCVGETALHSNLTKLEGLNKHLGFLFKMTVP